MIVPPNACFGFTMTDNTINATVLVIDDEPEIRYSLERVLTAKGARVIVAASGEEGIEVARQERPEVILLDIRMGGMSGLETLQHLRGISKSFMVVLMTAYGTTQTAIEAMKFGAFDYIIKPFDVQKILHLVTSAAEACRDTRGAETREASPLLNAEDYKEGIVGSSEPMQEVFKTIGQVASSNVTVLITGESGTGKELVARCLYQHSHRSDKAFVAVNCAAIPENLIESELFGHERGAFTGATNQRIGKFEVCDGGTIFLDEIGDMALTTQTKILRAIQEGEIQRVGGSGTIKVDVRLIAATNKDLEKMVEEGEFREDLYYRLNVVRLRLPTLRERKSDIPQLVDFMLQRLSKTQHSKLQHVSTETLDILSRYTWPGNVRELENVIHRSAVIAKGDTILPKDLPVEICEAAGRSTGSRPPFKPEQAEPNSANESVEEVPESEVPPSQASAPKPPSVQMIGHDSAPVNVSASMSLDEAFDVTYKLMRDGNDKLLLQVMEEAIIDRALKEMKGNQVKTSALLGITRATLRKRIDQFGLKY